MMRYGPGVALVVVDMQNDFGDPRGSLHVVGAEAIVPVVNAQIALARANGALVVFSQDWHPGHTPHFAADGGAWPVHCVADTWGAELCPELDCPPGSPLIRKGTNGEDGYSAFTMRDPDTGATVPTPLETLLHEAGVDDGGGRGPGHRLLRPEHGARRGPPRPPHDGAHRRGGGREREPRATGERALDELGAAGVVLASSLAR